MEKSADLIIDKPERNVDLYYAIKFWVPDEIIYFKVRGRKYLLPNDLEIGRAKQSAAVNHVLSLSKYLKKAREINKNADSIDALILLLKEKNIERLRVPESTSFTYVDRLREAGFGIKGKASPFYIKRFEKSDEEVTYIYNAQSAVFSAMHLAENILKKSKIEGDKLMFDRTPLTSQRVREAIELHLYEKGYITPEETIVAGGMDAIDPHNTGSGELRPHEAIVVDIFPRSKTNRFFGDATRTFCKGDAPKELKRMYNVVKRAQIDAVNKIRAGVNGKKIHEDILKYFEEKGYKTGDMNGRKQGFIHSTGHGIGLELHEEPLRIKPSDYIMQEGFVVSVEPGLYYKDIGGVRIEDLVYITKSGCRVLSKYHKNLEVK